MDLNSVKTKKIRIAFTIALCVVMALYYVVCALPMITYTHQTGDLAGQEETISLSSFIWKPYNHADITGTQPLNDLFKAELQKKVNLPINHTIPGPLFAFVGAFISILVVAICWKKAFNVYFPVVWGVGSILLYLINPLLQLSIIDSSILMLHYILFALAIVITIAEFFLISLPQIKHERANKELY